MTMVLVKVNKHRQSFLIIEIEFQDISTYLKIVIKFVEQTIKQLFLLLGEKID